MYLHLHKQKQLIMKEINDFRKRWRIYEAHGLTSPIWREIEGRGEIYTPLTLVIFHNGNIKEDNIRYYVGKLYQGGFLERSPDNKAFYRANKKAVEGMEHISKQLGTKLQAQTFLNALCNGTGRKIFDCLFASPTKSATLSTIYDYCKADTDSKQSTIRQFVGKFVQVSIAHKNKKLITLNADALNIIQQIQNFINATNKK